MQEFYWVSGNLHYIYSKDFNEIRSFNSFGELQDEGMPTRCSNMLSVDILSILGESGKKYSEVYFSGKTSEVNKGYLDVYSALDKIVKKESYLVYKVSHGKNVVQILLVLVKNTSTIEQISSVIECSDWVSI